MDYHEVYDGLNEMFTDYFIDVGASPRDMEIRDMALKAVKLQIPKPPERLKVTENLEYLICPTCRKGEVSLDHRCSCCGQAIDWSEVQL